MGELSGGIMGMRDDDVDMTPNTRLNNLNRLVHELNYKISMLEIQNGFLKEKIEELKEQKESNGS